MLLCRIFRLVRILVPKPTNFRFKFWAIQTTSAKRRRSSRRWWRWCAFELIWIYEFRRSSFPMRFQKCGWFDSRTFEFTCNCLSKAVLQSVFAVELLRFIENNKRRSKRKMFQLSKCPANQKSARFIFRFFQATDKSVCRHRKIYWIYWWLSKARGTSWRLTRLSPKPIQTAESLSLTVSYYNFRWKLACNFVGKISFKRRIVSYIIGKTDKKFPAIKILKAD